MSIFTTANAIFDEINQPDQLSTGRYRILYRYLTDVLSQGNRLHLYSLFAKISYIDSQFNLTDTELRAMHVARKSIENGKEHLTPKDIAAYNFSLHTMLYKILNVEQVEWLDAAAKWAEVDNQAYEEIDRKELIRAAIVEVDHDQYKVKVIDDDSGNKFTALFNISETNEQFNISIKHLDKRIQLPVIAHFMDNRFVSSDSFIPSTIVIDPDYLIDVTAIAESFTSTTELPLIYLMRQLTPKSSSHHLLLGNIANMMLDRFMLGQSITHEKLMTEVFQMFALEFTLLSDEDVKKVSSESKQLLNHLFEDVAILKNENQSAVAYIEPTFISGRYGIQGRLDALFLDTDYNAGKIVELKSGKPYRENEYGLNRNHYVQTILYDLAVKNAFGDNFQSTNYILYCKLPSNRLRRAPTIKHVQSEALKVRNDIVAIVHHMMHCEVDESLLFKFNHPLFDQVGGFIRRDAKGLYATVASLSDIEKAHLCVYSALIVNDNYVAKVGGEIRKKRMGFSALWQAAPEEKEEQFNIYRNLKIEKALDNGVYQFAVSEKNTLTNFRRGDIVVLYPTSREDHPTFGQLLKGSIISISSTQVAIRLRNPLIRAEVFESITAWNAEHDHIESSTRNALRSLFGFYRLSKTRRNILLGIDQPRSTEFSLSDNIRFGLTTSQRGILENMISAKDYFLLWGPPGTGKTSIMLAAYVRFIMEQTNDSLLLVAYTNRAVDEICAVLNKYYPDDYIRIGSRFSVDASLQDKLLQKRLIETKTRKAVKKLIQSCRLITGTVSSISGKDELFTVKQFHRMVVDEASQILEPQLLGLMAKVDCTVLIGDHKQLPAVVASSSEQTTINQDALKSIGFSDASMSLFERLMRRSKMKGWSRHIGRLHHQGRMHKDICTFVSSTFYENKLEIVKHNDLLYQRLTRPMSEFYLSDYPQFQQTIINRRINFIDYELEEVSPYDLIKMNEVEADIVSQIVATTLKVLPEKASVGIICPFRAQIAIIKQKLDEQMEVWPESVTIDTVERYQGGARDIIILSTCAVNERSLHAIQSSDVDGVDRKLNVALSRAREQIIVVGSAQVLNHDPTYRSLIDYASALR